jgi:ribosomal protein S18 acetylase RimI-like enzyme
MAEQRYTIRAGTADDAGAVAAMWKRMAEQHRAYDAEVWCWSSDAPVRWRDAYAKFAESDDMVLRVAEDDRGELIGFANARCKESPDIFATRRLGEVWDLYVEPARRGEGIGLALMEETFDGLKTRGAENVILHVAMANPEAVEFYRKLGMRPVMYRMHKRL